MINIIYENTNMNYYQKEFFKIRDLHFPHEYQISRIIQAKHFIDHSSPNNINLENTAASACLSKFHFTRLFKKCYGRTPHQYVTSIRMAKAKQLLQSGITVSDTCFSLGFSSVTSFTGLFKKMTGFTPGHYRQKKQF